MPPCRHAYNRLTSLTWWPLVFITGWHGQLLFFSLSLARSAHKDLTDLLYLSRFKLLFFLASEQSGATLHFTLRSSQHVWPQRPCCAYSFFFLLFFFFSSLVRRPWKKSMSGFIGETKICRSGQTMDGPCSLILHRIAFCGIGFGSSLLGGTLGKREWGYQFPSTHHTHTSLPPPPLHHQSVLHSWIFLQYWKYLVRFPGQLKTFILTCFPEPSYIFISRKIQPPDHTVFVCLLFFFLCS